MLAKTPYVRRIAARLLDFFEVHAPWQRRLWHVGLLTSLQEAYDASYAVRDRALGIESLRWFSESLRGRVGQDPAAGGNSQRSALLEVLKSDRAADGFDHTSFGLLVEDVRAHYLERWEAALSVPQPGIGVERTARAIAGYLLDAGNSQNALHRWLTALMKDESNVYDIQRLLAAVQEYASRPMRRHQVMVLLTSLYPRNVSRPEELMSRLEATSWLNARGAAELVTGIELQEGLLLRVHAHDKWAAAERAGEITDALLARAAIGTRNQLQIHPEVFVRPDIGRLVPMHRRRRVDVRAIERQNRLMDDFSTIATDPVDAALQLLSHLDNDSPESAATSGWSAIEALLTAPGDGGNVVAASRLAALVACAWPRAELTTLAARRANLHLDDELDNKLERASTNRRRAELIADEIQAGRWLRLEDRSNECAVRRMEQLINHPQRELAAVQRYAESAVRRLYRQRNLIAHGGQTSAIALRPSLRTVAPLIGAGMDRIVHAYLVEGVTPLQIAARAQLELDRAGSEDASPLTALLERPRS